MSTATTTTRPGAVTTGPGSGKPVASYGRRSKRATGDGKGASINIADQHVQNASYAGDLFPGSPVVEYSDNMSAWNPDAHRADWERLLSDVAAGNYRAVVGRYADRLTRQPEQGERLLAACKASGTELHTTSAGHVTSALMFRIELALAAEESDQKSRRMMDKHRTIADRGGFHGGKRRFGYNTDMTAVDADEAAVIVELAGRLLAGESLRSLSMDMERRGIRGPLGGVLTGPNIRGMLRKPHLAGIRVHNGAETPASWPAILDEATHRRLVEHTGKPERRTAPSPGRVYLLSGNGGAVCDACGSVIRGRPRTGRGEARAYVCHTGRHFHRDTVTVDAAMVARVTHQLARLDTTGALTDVGAELVAAELRANVDALNGRVAELDDAMAEGELDAKAYGRAVARIETKLETARAELATAETTAARPLDVLAGLTGTCPGEAFTDLPLGRQRAVIGVLASSVRLVGTNGKRRPFDPEADLLIEWR